MDCDASLDPRDLPRVADPVLAGEADLVLGARVAEPGAWPLHARVANRAARLRAASAHRRRAARPRADARRPPRGAARARARRPPLRLAAGDGAARRRRRLAIDRGRRSPTPARGPLEGDRHGPRHRPRGPRHGGGAARDAHADRDREGAGARSRQDAADARRARPRRPPRSPRPRCADTLAAVARARRAGRRVLVLDGEPGAVAAHAASTCSRSAAAGWPSGSPRRSPTSAARRFLIGMDTPQVTPAAARRRAARARRTRDAAFGPALDGGYWASGCAGPTRPCSPACR